MPTVPITLIKGDRIANSVETDYRDALPVNMYAVQREILNANGYMKSFPGLTAFADGVGTDRGGNYNERFNEHYRVSGEKFIKIDTDGTVTELGDIPGAKQARLKGFYSFNTQAIIADGNMFLYSPTGGFQQITDPDLGNPIDGVWINQYYFMTDGEFLFHTDIDDETAIDPLKFATAEFMPDPSLAVDKTQDNKVIVFGRYSLEYFIDTASENFAFQRLENRAQKIGIVATHAKCEAEGSFYIVGGYKQSDIGVYSVGLGGSKKESTYEIDKILNAYNETELSDMRVESFAIDGISFVLIHLPYETLCFNLTIAKVFGIKIAWTILKSGFSSVQTENNYRAINGIFDLKTSQWFFGDKRNRNIGLLDHEFFAHYNAKTEMILFTPFINLERASINFLEIETIPGHTITDDAKIFVSLTYDGVTYGKEWVQLYGAKNDYGRRFIIRRLGYIRDKVGFKFRTVTDSRMAFALIVIDFS